MQLPVMIFDLPFWQQAVLIILSWLAISLAPMGRKAFEDRNLPPEQRRGTSIFPGLFVSLLFVAFILFNGRTVLSAGITFFHVLAGAMASVMLLYWTVRIKLS